MKDEMMMLVKAISSRSAEFTSLVPKPQRDEMAEADQAGKRTALLRLALSVGALSSVLVPNQERAMAVDSMSLPTLLIPASHQGYQVKTSPEVAVNGGELAPLPLAKGELWEILQSRQVPSTIVATGSQSYPKEILTEQKLTSIPRETSEAVKVLEVQRLQPPAASSRLKLEPIERHSSKNRTESALKLQQRQGQALKNLRQQKQKLLMSLTQLRVSEQDPSQPAQALSEPELIVDAALLTDQEQTNLSTQKPLEVSTGSVISTEQFFQIPQSQLSIEQVYQVKPGDTLQEIADHYQLSSAYLAAANKLDNPDLIRIDQQLQIPSVKELPTASPLRASKPKPVQSADQQSLETDTYAEKLKADVAKLQQEYRANPSQQTSSSSTQVPNGERSYSRRTLGRQRGQQARQSSSTTATAPVEIEYHSRLQPLAEEMLEPELPPLSSPEPYLPDSDRGTRFTGYIWPAAGVLTSGYGRRWGRMHKGIDVAGPIGTPIVAVASGQVISAGWNSGGYGNVVKVKHDNGSLSLYAHNSRVLVRQGQHVEQGQLIAEMGNSGYSTGPHLHFELYPEGKEAANPMAYLPKLK